MSEQDVLDKLDDVLDRINDNKEKISKLESRAGKVHAIASNVLKMKVQVVNVCSTCWGTGLVEEDVCPACEGQRVVPI